MQITVTWRLILVRALLSSLATSSIQRLESVRYSLTEAVVETTTTIRVCRNAPNNATLTVGSRFLNGKSMAIYIIIEQLHKSSLYLIG